MKTWKIYIVTPSIIYENYYQFDDKFSSKNWSFFNVINKSLIYSNYDIINYTDVKYISLGKWYAEGEVIYNIYKNELYKSYDYIGFLHYDFDLGNRSVTDLINNLLQNNPEFISFNTYSFFVDYNQHIMMDERYPNQLVGRGKNCYIKILEDYNFFYKKMIFLHDLWNKRINLCSAFLVRKDIFEDMMAFISYVIESKYLDKFDTEHKYRFQGGMFERYVAMYSSQISFIELPIIHKKP